MPSKERERERAFLWEVNEIENLQKLDFKGDI
jgi:hypothetical protein